VVSRSLRTSRSCYTAPPSGVVLPSGEGIAEDIEVVLHGPSAVVLSQPGEPRKMHVHRQTGNSSIAGIGKLPAPDRHCWRATTPTPGLGQPLLVACATYRLRCAFPIRNGEAYPRGADAPRSRLHARHIACDMRFRFAAADVSHGGLTPPALGGVHGARSPTK
jgi:hypothetical protein